MITFMTGLFCPLKVIVYFRMTSDKIYLKGKEAEYSLVTRI